MKGEIQLYIGGVPVELTQAIDILFTFSVDELTNPTIVKNSYSKTITIEDSPNNSQLFGQFWNVERIQTLEGGFGTTFNPSKRVPFTLFVNGQIYQEGYAKLLSVDTTGKNTKYSLNLFGGLGSFWYNLSYQGDDNEGDNKKKLSDLHFMTGSTTPSEREFDFVIKKETIEDAWNNVTADTSSMWHFINFADCYDGYPEDFDADKVLVNLGETASTQTSSDGPPARRPGGRTTANSFITTTATTDGTYASYDGYVLAELPKERTAAEMREFRSYLMRPVVRVKEIINACCNPENNGGYEVDLDPTFFNSDNPYWEKAWMTLPLLTSMDFNGNEGDDQTGVTVSIGATTSGGTRTGDIYTETTVFNIGTITANTDFNISMDLDVFAIMNSLPSSYVLQDSTPVSTHDRNGVMYMSPCGIYPCAYSTLSDTYYLGAIEIQLVAYSRDGKVITGSEVFNCTSGYHAYRTSAGGGRGQGATQVVTYIPTPNDFSAFTPGYETTYTTKSGEFRPVNGSSTNWKMKDKLSFVLKKLPKTCTLKLIVSKVNAQSSSWSGDRAMRLYQRYYTNYTKDSQGYLNSNYSTAYRNPATINHFEYEISNVMVSLSESGEAIRTGAKFGKADLLNTDYTPAEFFLSYAKLFGLYFEKDKYADTIYVRTRNTFYRKENVIDLSKNIDRSKTSQITPLVFDAKWYNFKLDSDGSLFGDQYESTYGQPYGIQRVNTGYNFDASEKNLYDGNVFKGGIECLEKSDMFGYVSGNTQVLVDAAWKPWMFDGYSYNLYNVNDMSDTVEMEMPTMTKKGSILSYSKNKYYDLYTKLQFHGDDNSAAEGANVLVFFNGSVPTKTLNTDQELNYWITDDNTYMNTLNDGNPCWLYTTTDTDKGGSSIALKVTEIPHFTRNLAKGTDITQCWDFGYVKQLFMPDYGLEYANTLYTNYWQSYIRDMYDVNTKKMTCYVKFDERPEQEWLRDFYWYDNCIWRIQKIEDYNVVSQDSAKVEFIKVQDVNNYSNVDVSAIAGLSISASTTNLTQSGGSVTIYVTTTDDWYVSDYTYTSYNASASSGHGNGSFTIQLSANKNNYNVVHHINVLGGDGQSAWCEIVQNYATLTVREFAQFTGSDIPWTGGTQMYDVLSTYPWTVTNVDSRSYVTLDPVSGSGGTLANHFECTFAPSDSLAPRNVCMRFTDSQGNYIDVWKWQEQCKGLTFQYTGGTQVVKFLSGASATTPDWLSVTDNGDNTYNVTAIENPDMSARTVSIYFNYSDGSSQSMLQVVQYAGVIFDVTRVDGTGSVLAAGGTIQLAVTSNGPWSITTYSNWSVPQTMSGSTSDTINVVVAQNDDEARKGTIMFQHNGGIYYYTVSQNGINTDNFVDPVALIFPGTGGTSAFTITTSDTWRIVGKPGWISVSTTGGTGNATVSVTADTNTGYERAGSIVIEDQTKGKTYVVSVMQQVGNVFMVARVNGSGDIPATGGLCYLEVTSPEKAWTASTSDNFISLDKTSWTASTGLYVTFTANTGSNRTATINFVDALGQTLTYTQTQAGNNASGGWVSPGFISFTATGGTADTQTVTVNVDDPWQIVAYPNWVTFSPSSGTGSTTVDVVAIPYSGNVDRTGTMVFYDTVTRGTAIVAVSQAAGQGEILAVSPSELRYTHTGGTATLTIIANTDWTIG